MIHYFIYNTEAASALWVFDNVIWKLHRVVVHMHNVQTFFTLSVNIVPPKIRTFQVFFNDIVSPLLLWPFIK